MKDFPKDIGELENLQKEIEVHKQLAIQKSLESKDANEIMKAYSYFSNMDKQTDKNIKSYIFDPFATANAMGYRDKTVSLSYDTLRQMSDMYVIRAIIETYKDKGARFCGFTDNEQNEGWTIRKKRRPFMDEKDMEMSRGDKRQARDIAEFIQNAGTLNNKWSRDDFETFFRKTTHDSMGLDQMTYEIVRSRKGYSDMVRFGKSAGIVEYFATDGATYRLADTGSQYKDREIKGEKVNGYFPSYVQVYQNQIVSEFYPWELCFGIRNQRSDIKLNGYGKPELEDLIRIVTWMLNSDQYNGAFFCISLNTNILTDLGIKKVNELVDKKFKIFNGVTWENATAYETGEKELCITKLYNGLICETSLDHKFLVVDKDFNGEPVWKKQSELTINDYCLVNNEAIDYEINYDLLFIDKIYKREFTNPTQEILLEYPKLFIPTKEMVDDLEFWEMLGFGFLDGHFGENQWQIFPHYEKDKFLFGKFSKICEKYDLNYKIKMISKKVRRSDGELGYPIVAIYQTTFLDWLYELGFNKSEDGKIFPDFIYSLPIKQRCAFLRGMFSADGHTQNNIMGYSTPSISKQNEDIRLGIIMLLYSVGIGCKEILRSNNHYEIWVSDVIKFAKTVGYLQDYKNKNLIRHNKTKNKWDLLSREVSIYIAGLIKYKGNRLKLKRNRDALNDVLRGDRILSRNKAIEYLMEASINIPWWLNYQFVKVQEIKNTGKKEIMYDIEVFDDQHLFLANFIGVHNSAGSAPKGILKVAGNVSQPMLDQFKQAWYNQVVGVGNAWKIPVIQSEKMDWVDLQQKNTDMQFHLFSQYLRLIACALYKIDPIEIGFRNESEGNSIFDRGKDKQYDKSNEKGFEPYMKFWAKRFDKMVVSELTDDFEFVFCGLAPDDEEKILESDIKKVGSFEQLNEVRKRRGLEDLEDGDVVLNPQYLQYKQMKAMGSPESNQAMDEYTGDSSGNAYSGESDNPFENLTKSVQDRINGYTETLIEASRELSS